MMDAIRKGFKAEPTPPAMAQLDRLLDRMMRLLNTLAAREAHDYPYSRGTAGSTTVGDAMDVLADDIEALEAALAADAAALAAHEADSDPHPQYLTAAEGDAAYDPIGSASSAVGTHESTYDHQTVPRWRVMLGA